jgi:hypothetical protein
VDAPKIAKSIATAYCYATHATYKRAIATATATNPNATAYAVIL